MPRGSDAEIGATRFAPFLSFSAVGVGYRMSGKPQEGRTVALTPAEKMQRYRDRHARRHPQRHDGYSAEPDWNGFVTSWDALVTVTGNSNSDDDEHRG